MAIIDVQNDAGRRLENSIRSSGGEALFLGCDVGVEDQVDSSLDQAAEHFGSLQIVVNGAGWFTSSDCTSTPKPSGTG